MAELGLDFCRKKRWKNCKEYRVSNKDKVMVLEEIKGKPKVWVAITGL